MVAGIELGREYVQLCVKTESMKEPESLSKIAGEEHYRMPVEADLDDKEQLMELFRRLWKLLSPYGNKNSLEVLVVCLEEHTASLRETLLEVTEIYGISKEKVFFLEREECFASYVIHQQEELLSQRSLLIENCQGEKRKFLLKKQSKTLPPVMEVENVSEKSLEAVFEDTPVSSVFLVGDDYEEDWIGKNLKVLKKGKRVFQGKNLFVKGACYFADDLRAKKMLFFYLGKEKVKYHVMLFTGNYGAKSYLEAVQGGRNWYDSSTQLDVILMEDTSLEFALVPINGKEKKTVIVELKDLPNRPPKTTRLHIEIQFYDPGHARLVIRDLGFGELFSQSDMVYEGELQWEQ